MAVSRSIWQNIQQYSWLVLALFCLFAGLVCWATIDQDELIPVKHPDEVDTQVPIEPEKVAVTTHLGTLSDEVKPLDLTTRVVVTNEHTPEFRGTKFLSENKSQWTVEIFRSANEDIIKNFLLSREDRNQFIYFRLSGQDQPEQYVLAYGAFSSAETAKQQFAQLHLTLPPSIQPKAQQLKLYTDFVNDMGSDELKSTAQLYAVQLKPAALPKIDEVLLRQRTLELEAQKAIDPSMTVKTTITQRDEQGNVVNIHQSHSAPTSTEHAEQPDALKEMIDSMR